MLFYVAKYNLGAGRPGSFFFFQWHFTLLHEEARISDIRFTHFLPALNKRMVAYGLCLGICVEWFRFEPWPAKVIGLCSWIRHFTLKMP